MSNNGKERIGCAYIENSKMRELLKSQEEYNLLRGELDGVLKEKANSRLEDVNLVDTNIVKILNSSDVERVDFVISTTNKYFQFIVAFGENCDAECKFDDFIKLSDEKIELKIREALLQMPDDVFQELLVRYFSGGYSE